MAVEIQKRIGEIVYFHPKVGNTVAQTGVIAISVGDGVVGASGTFEMPVDSENEYELSGQVMGFVGIHDVTIKVAEGPEGWPVIDERVFQGEFEVIGAPTPTVVTVTITNKNAPTTWKYSHDLWAGWNFVAYQGETTTVRNAVESIQAYLLNIGYYIGTIYYEYGMDDTVEQGSAVAVNVSQACTWGMPPKVEAPYWAGLTDRSIIWCPFTPMNENFVWTIYADELAMFACYDATQHRIDTPNSGLFLDWGIFKDGETYTWDWATGELEGVFG